MGKEVSVSGLCFGRGSGVVVSRAGGGGGEVFDREYGGGCARVDGC